MALMTSTMCAVNCYVKLHAWGYNDHLPPPQPDYYRAVSVDGVTYMNVSRQQNAEHGIYTYLVNASSCSATDRRYFDTYSSDDAVRSLLRYLNALTSGMLLDLRVAAVGYRNDVTRLEVKMTPRLAYLIKFDLTYFT